MVHVEHVEITTEVIQNAAIAIVLMSIISGIVGCVLVSNRMVFIGGGVAHCAYGGIGLAMFCGFSTLLGAAISAVIVALVFAFVKHNVQHRMDHIMAVLWSLGMSIGVILMEIKHVSDVHVDVESYLFGSLFSVDTSLITYMAIYDVLLILIFTMYYREIMCVSYDMDFARLKKLNTKLITSLIFVSLSVGIILSMQVSGLILVIAMISIPAYNALLFTDNMRTQMVYSFLFSLVFMLVGFAIAIHFRINAGASITLVSVLFLLLSYAFTLLARRFHGTW